MAAHSDQQPEFVPFTIAGIDHVVLRAHDPRRLIVFYRDVLGCPVEREQPDIDLVQLRAGRCLIDVVPRRARPGEPAPGGAGDPNLDHLCLLIWPFDGARIRAHLRACGVAPGELALRYGAEGEGPSLYLNDPEGNGIELKAAAAPGHVA